ncbi:hypothetical protein [Kitasatospora sp. NPDC088548]|uniref:hypothetical protein n=1 Tax=Kitasatospora sp. NPDC088548 TaxID=3364075 RepID=UPI00381FB0D5
MTTSSRSRKAVADAVPAGNSPADEVAPAPEMAPASTPLPTAAPLEPPTGEPTEPPAAPDRVPVADAIPATLAGLIIDSATGRPPTDLDAIFEKVTAHGTTQISLLRLVEHTADHHGRTMTKLLAARGAHLSGDSAASIMQRLNDQADVRNAITT